MQEANGSRKPGKQKTEAPLGGNFWCERKAQWRVHLACPNCDNFIGCGQVTNRVLDFLVESGRYEKYIQSFNERTRKMIIARKEDDSLELLNCDIKDITPDMIQEVREIFQISKVYEPVVTVRMVAKSEAPPLLSETAYHENPPNIAAPAAPAATPKPTPSQKKAS